MTRRQRNWKDIARMAREAGGVWRLHPDMTVCTLDTLHHVRRRVRAFRPTETHRYEFARTNEGADELGRRVFDIIIRYIPEGTEP